MSLRLLVDAPEFTEAVARDLAAARRTALVRAMTSEGDAAGLAVAARFAGFCFRRFPARNHKKLVALDGRVAYFGGSTSATTTSAGTT